jgi:serine/threonine protein kinase
MANADYKPDLSSLENDYQILSELHRSDKSRTFLARHIGLNRDVTITVVHSRDEADRQMLTQLAADTRILASARHPNIIPVLEGRQLWADTFAVVRARVRGSTLHQLVAEIGPLPLPRAALENINAALEWARKGGILLRQVSPDEVVFQQGSGRVLLAFDPTIPMADSSLDRCADARTIGRLAWEMLAGRPVDDPSGKSLTALRPDLPKRIIDETNALMNCRREGPAPNTAAYIAMLGNPPSVLSGRGPMVPGALGVVVPAAAAQARPRAADNSALVAERGLGFNGRVAVAAAVLAVIVLVALVVAAV